jgi:hypothetical protein
LGEVAEAENPRRVGILLGKSGNTQEQGQDEKLGVFQSKFLLPVQVCEGDEKAYTICMLLFESGSWTNLL